MAHPRSINTHVVKTSLTSKKITISSKSLARNAFMEVNAFNGSFLKADERANKLYRRQVSIVLV